MKHLYLPFGIALILDIIGTVINFLGFRSSGHFPLGFRTYGGECMMESGFGMRAFHTYAMSPEESDSVRMWFSLPDFLIWLLAGTVLILIVIVIIKAVAAARKN